MTRHDDRNHPEQAPLDLQAALDELEEHVAAHTRCGAATTDIGDDSVDDTGDEEGHELVEGDSGTGINDEPPG